MLLVGELYILFFNIVLWANFLERTDYCPLFRKGVHITVTRGSKLSRNGVCRPVKSYTFLPQICLDLVGNFCHLSSYSVELDKTYPYSVSSFALKDAVQNSLSSLLSNFYIPLRIVFHLQCGKVVILSETGQVILCALSRWTIEVSRIGMCLPFLNARHFFKSGRNLIFNSYFVGIGLR